MHQTYAASCGERAQLGATTAALDGKMQFDIWLRKVRQGLVCPFDKAHAIGRKVFIKPCIQEFVRVVEAIKIKVIQRYSRNSIRF